MKIYIAMLLAFCMGAFLCGCQDQGASAKPVIALVDMARVMRDSAPGKEGVKFLENRQTILQKELDEIQDKVEKNPEDEKAIQELQRVFAMSQQRMQAEQQNVVNILYDAVQRVVNEYRQKEGYEIILGTEAVASFNPDRDVTAAIIAEVDKQKLEFKPLPDARLPQKGEIPSPEAEKVPANEKAGAAPDGDVVKDGTNASPTGEVKADEKNASPASEAPAKDSQPAKKPAKK